MLSWWIILIIVVLVLVLMGLAMWLMFRRHKQVPYGKKFKLRLSTKTALRHLLINANALMGKYIGKTNGVSQDSIDTIMQLKFIPITFQCVPKSIQEGSSFNEGTRGFAGNVRGFRGDESIPLVPLSPPIVPPSNGTSTTGTATGLYDRYDCEIFNELYFMFKEKSINEYTIQQEQYWTMDKDGLVLNIMVEGQLLKFFPSLRAHDGTIDGGFKMLRGDIPSPAEYKRISLKTVHSGHFSYVTVPTIDGYTMIIPIKDIVDYVTQMISNDEEGGNNNHTNGVDGMGTDDEIVRRYFVKCPDTIPDNSFFIDLIHV